MAAHLRKLDFKHGCIELIHGSGGCASHQLFSELFLPEFTNPNLALAHDSAVLSLPPGRVVLATDAHVVSPLFFPGGDIGCLAVNGTVNDLAMSGARPLYLTASFILEAGFALAELRLIVRSMAECARRAGVSIVAGDTKVVEQGKGDGVFISTTGLGVVADGIHIDPSRIQVGDRILVSGPLGDHGIAVLSQREHLDFVAEVVSDCAPLHELVAAMLQVAPALHCLRDPTRGGLATVLNELAQQSQLGMEIEEAAIPLQMPVRAACELLGLDPLYLASEGRLVAFFAPDLTPVLLETMHQHPLGRQAVCIGTVTDVRPGSVALLTAFGGRRLLPWLAGDPLPRIC